MIHKVLMHVSLRLDETIIRLWNNKNSENSELEPVTQFYSAEIQLQYEKYVISIVQSND